MKGCSLAKTNREENPPSCGSCHRTGTQDGAGANIKHSVRGIALDSRSANVYRNLNTARKFYECCVANLGERTQNEWMSEGRRIEYNRRHFIWISQKDAKDAMEIPRNIDIWVPPGGKKGTQALHGVCSTHRSL